MSLFAHSAATRPSVRQNRRARRIRAVAAGAACTVAMLCGQPSSPACAQESRPDLAEAQGVAHPSPSPERPPTPSPISGPRELLKLYGLDESRLQSFVDGRPLGGDETETLMRFLYAVRRFRLADIDRWTLRDASWEDFVLDAEKHRGEIVPLSGRVVRVSVEKPLPEVVARFDLPRYYRCDVRLGADERPATIYTLSVPAAWKLDGPLDERISASAFFVKLATVGEGAEPGGEKFQPIFVTQRLAWHPKTLLGDLNMDLGLFDEVREGRRIAPEEREAFYRLLAAVGHAGTRELLRHSAQSSGALIELLQKPKRHSGELLTIDGVALRAVLVRVDEPDIVARFGIDHYYELAVSVDLPQPVKFEGQLFGTFPTVICVRQLPAGMPTGENIHEHVRVPGFFFKVWSYRTEAAGGADDSSRRQIAPLLVGREPLWIQNEEVGGGASSAAAILVGLFVAGIAALWLVVWLLGRGDARSQASSMVKRCDPEAGVSLDDLRLADAGEPDSRGHESPRGPRTDT
jgi:hypothetical protein